MSRDLESRETPTEPRGRIRKILARLHGGTLTPRRLALSVALGLFVGSSPAFGFHALIAGTVALALRLDVLITYLATNISLPPLIPVLLFFQLQVGSLLLEGRFRSLGWNDLEPQKAIELGAFVFVGFPVVAGVIAFLGGLGAYAIGLRMEAGGRKSREPSDA